MTKQRIGLFGYGCVGQGFTELLLQNKQLDAEIVKVCVKHPNKPRPGLTGQVVFDPDEILEDDSIDIVVELIDDASAALDIVSKALTNGKKVVSANKKMIAENLKLLDELQQKHKGTLLFEGAVCGSIPVISNIRNYYAHDDIQSISGIFNGSTNYILTKVIDQKLSYEQALSEAKKNGFAESDPTLDVEGYDPSFKLSILIRQAFNTYINPADILRVGITRISKADVQFAEENGLKIKLIAQAFKSGNKIKALVAPQFVDASDPLHGVDLEYNAVKFTSNTFGEQLLTGKGAGKLPTGLAVLADVGEIIAPKSKTHSKAKSVRPGNDDTVEVYLGFDQEASVDLSLFSKIKEKYIGRTYNHLIGQIRISDLDLLVKKHPEASIILTSGKQLENNLSRLTYTNAIEVGTV